MSTWQSFYRIGSYSLGRHLGNSKEICFESGPFCQSEIAGFIFLRDGFLCHVVQNPHLEGVRSSTFPRRCMGRTQEAFAQEVGTTRLQVTRWENGAAEPNRMAQRLPELLSEKVDGQATA